MKFSMPYKKQIFATFAFLLAFSLSASFAFAQDYQPNQPIVVDCVKGAPNCEWSDLMVLLNRIVQFLVYFAASIATLGFAYAGFTYLTAFGNMEKISKAHKMFRTILWGIAFVLCGWLLVATILKTLGVNPDYSMIDTSSVQIIETP
jgi:hypothetical protein